LAAVNENDLAASGLNKHRQRYLDHTADGVCVSVAKLKAIRLRSARLEQLCGSSYYILVYAQLWIIRIYAIWCFGTLGAL